MPLPYQLTLSHAHLGGLLDGIYTFWSLHPFSASDAPSAVGRSLPHIIGVALPGGTPVAAPPLVPAGSVNFIEWGDVLPASDPLILIRCRSVFSPTRWTLRQLGAAELMAVFDIPQQEKPTAAKYRRVQDLPFLGCAPIKLLYQALTSWSLITRPAEHANLSVSLITPQPVAYPEHCFGQIAAQAANAVAVKADDAAVPHELWDERVWARFPWTEDRRHSYANRFGRGPLNAIRHLGLRVWRRNVRVSLLSYLKQMYGPAWATCQAGRRDREVGRECLWRTTFCDWWEWLRGSTLFFWRWPPGQRHLARDGHPVWWIDEPPKCMKLQPKEKDPYIREKVRLKLENDRGKKYISPGSVSNVTSYSAVQKGDSDIRLVYDATRSGLNRCIWVPSFVLPPPEALTDRLTPTSWMSDHDIGEMFLNFPMHHSLQPYCGIDVRPYCHPGSTLMHVEHWVRCMMGWVAAPYITTQSLAFAKEVIVGDRSCPRNPYQWSTVVLNLPGQEVYMPSLPWVHRITPAGDIASDCLTYVDDGRIIGSSLTACRSADHRFATLMCYLGIQIAARKVRPPSQAPGAWAGVVTLVGPEGVAVTCLLEKWAKVQGILHDTLQEVRSGGLLCHKTLEQWRGFLNHIQCIFPAMTPFLKGFHLTLDGWRPGQAEDMWKLPTALVDLDWEEGSMGHPEEPPQRVPPAPRLVDDLMALEMMFQGEVPAVRLLRPARLGVIIYGIGDASGAGYGSAFADASSVWYYFGVWGADAEDASSNYRELRNLTESIELGVQTGQLHDCEMFVFTDNSTAEAAYYKGNSDSRDLFELVVRLRHLDMSGSLRLHITHIAGARMIASGMDGLSRGNLTEGLMLSPTPAAFSHFVPLHLSATQRAPRLLQWLRSWIPFQGIVPLQPDDWFIQGHGLTGRGQALSDGGWHPEVTRHVWFLWDPPPAAAGAAVEELSSSRHKRPHLNHVFICPRLFTQYWRKRLYKVADIILELPPGTIPEWPVNMHEPLLVALTLRFATVPPWQLRLSSSFLALGWAVQDMWRRKAKHDRHLLRQLCCFPSTLECM